MSNELKQTYRDVEIVYVERDDRWNFTVNGKERNRESLVKAKESIDRALDHERVEKPWEPFAAYLFRGGELREVKVTSQADTSRYSNSRQYWIAQGGKRSKEPECYLYAVTPENEKAIARWRELEAEIDRLSQEQRMLIDGMTKVQIPV